VVQASTTALINTPVEFTRREAIAAVLSKVIFGSLITLIALAAIPYGTADPWWKAIFSSLVFIIAIGWVIEGWLSGSWTTGGESVLLPMIALAVFSLLQTLSFGGSSAAGVSREFWNAISADPYQTRFFVMQLVALTIAGAMFYRYAGTASRINTIIFVIIGVALLSALFGIVRQTSQHQMGFGLPRLKPETGYGQFINKNHFALLMEMAFGLGLGLILAGRITRERALIYLAALLPIWTALVLSNSRGGLVAMMAQIVIAVMFFGSISSQSLGRSRLLKIVQSWPVRIALAAVLVVGVFLGTVWMGGDRLASNIEAVRHEFDDAIAASHVGGARKDTWRATLRMFKAHPIAGVGLGGYWIAVTAYHDASGVLTPQEAHNEYLELLASGGIIGFAIGVWFVFVVVKRMRQNLKSSDAYQRSVSFAAMLAITGVAVHSLVDFGLHMLVNALIFVALLTIATRPDIENVSPARIQAS
jgi:O-antigen ligase